MTPITYKDSGVDIDAGNESVRRIKHAITKTHNAQVLTNVGSFGSLFDIAEAGKGMKHPILVQSTDGVGTKIMIAAKMGVYNTIGMDIVNHCCNDILAMGAKPLTFLDYIAANTIDPEQIEQIVIGMADACAASGVALVGGETASMGGVYEENEFDIVGTITGIVEKEKIITGKNIQVGDAALGLASNGLHTNGYTLARKLFFDVAKKHVHDTLPELEQSIGETLLVPHTNYMNAVFALIDAGIEIKGLAHITGGGFIDNIPRILPENVSVEIKKNTWPILPIFTVMQKIGAVAEQEMYRTFNMGIGMVMIVAKDHVVRIKEALSKEVYEIGKVVEGDQTVVLREGG